MNRPIPSRRRLVTPNGLPLRWATHLRFSAPTVVLAFLCGVAHAEPPPAAPTPSPAEANAAAVSAAPPAAAPAAPSRATSSKPALKTELVKGAATKLIMPVLIKGQGACPPGATWQVVRDRAPVPRCKTPLQAGCMLSDGRRDGPWTQYNIKHACAFRSEVLTYKKGRRTGPAARFIVTCTGRKGARGRCRELLKEQGGYLDGKAHGMWLTVDAQGRKRSQHQVHTGVKHGPFYAFNSSGVLIGRGCYKEGAELWRFNFRQKDRWQTPCSADRLITKKPVGDGTTKVSASQAKASKLVRLAQATKLHALRVRYLRKAVELAPLNKGYQKLLAAAAAASAQK